MTLLWRRQGDKERSRRGDICVRSLVLSPYLFVSLSVVWLLTFVANAEAADPWVDTRQVGPFICQATFSLTEYEPLLAELQTLERELQRTLGVDPATDPIFVYLFSDAEAHREYLQKQYPDVPYRPALFVKEGGQANVYAYRHDKMDDDLRHECTHALLHASLPIVPIWLDEGLAKYFEVPENERSFEHPNFFWLRWNMRVGLISSMEELEHCRDLTEMGASEYRYAWAWVHFMLHGPEEAHTVLVQYLADIRRGVPAGQLSDRMADALPRPTDHMVRHFKHWHR